MSVAKGTGYVKGPRRVVVKKLVSHVKYLEHRQRGADETRADRTIFSKDRDAVGRHEVIDDVMDHTSSKVGYHKIVLSPSKEEIITDWREWTRGIMRDLESFKGQELHWYAVKHSNTDDPHVHIVLAGSGERKDTGKPKSVELYPKDYAFLRERGQARSGYSYDQVQRDREVSQQIPHEHIDVTHSVSKATERENPRAKGGIDR